jgi:CelD/BcsL family acetyltransferase involved in cellulose biosynthesis
VRSLCTAAELRAAIPRWQALRVKWWAERERRMNPEHGSARFLAFAEEVILAMVPRGLAVVCEVKKREELVGFTIDFHDASTFYYWKWGFDPAFASLRPGHILVAYHIRSSIEMGRSYYDFMLGDESYKYDYAPEDRAVLSLKLGNSRLRSRATLGLSALRRAGS